MAAETPPPPPTHTHPIPQNSSLASDKESIPAGRKQLHPWEKVVQTVPLSLLKSERGRNQLRATKFPARDSKENVKIVKASQFCFFLDDLYLPGWTMCSSQCSQSQTTDKDTTTGNRKHHRNHPVPHFFILCIYCTMLKPQNEHKYANSVPLQLHCLSAVRADKSIYRPFLQSKNSNIRFSSVFCLFLVWNVI